MVEPADIRDGLVEAGAARFVTEECTCSHGYRTCPAGRHGHWESDRKAPLMDVVARILHSALLPHAPAGPVNLGVTGAWRWLWATPEGIAKAESYAEDERVGRERWRSQQIEYAARRSPEANASLVSLWQRALAPAARQQLQETALAQARADTGKPAFVHLAATAYHFGCGVLVTVGSAVPASTQGWYGLIRPDPARLDMKLVNQLGLVLFTTPAEATALIRAAPAGTRVITVDIQPAGS
ncbi:hypothetical protein ABZ848_00305 [Streptomyces sp. NPDC047081]|uniref:hypothetical protein n=1 Tax=Streptomyces sp. NPDC047081 TaxID=3154706 RepID=UPI0033D042CB